MAKACIFFAAFYVMAYLNGGWADIFLASFKAKKSLSFRFAFGGCLFILLGMVSCLAGGMLGASAPAGIYITLFLTVITVAAASIVRRKVFVPGNFAPKAPDQPSLEVSDAVAAFAAMLLVALQVFAVIRFQNDNTQMLLPIGAAVRVYDTGMLSVPEPMSLFIGALSYVLNVHPLALVYVILPAPFILLYYLCYFATIQTVCKTRAGALTAGIFVTMLNVWGFQSEKLIPANLLLSWFSFPVYIVHGVLNVAAVILISFPERREKITANDEYSEEWDMKKHRIINARNLAIGLGVLALILASTVFVLNSKINRLYAATVNLQDDMNSRCSIYEYKPDGGTTAGYLIKESDGTLSFIGGGAAENAGSLREFFDKYGSSVSGWYVYSEEEADSGAMRELLSQQLVSVENVYVIDRRNITEK